MIKEQQLEKVFKTFSKLDGKIKMKDIQNILKELGVNTYRPTIISLVQKMVPQKTNQSLQTDQLLGYQQLKQLIELITIPFDKKLFQFKHEIQKTIAGISQILSGRDMTVRDRQFQGKFRLRVGDQQKYDQQIKIQIAKNCHKKITTPWLSIQFQVQKKQNKDKVQKIIIQIFNKILQLAISQNVKSESSIKSITIQTTQIEKGVRAIIEVRNKRFNDIQEGISLFFDKILKTNVDGKVKIELKFNKSVKQLIDLKRIEHIFTIISKDCEFVIQSSVSKIMTAIKQIVITSPQFLDLRYNKFHYPSLLAIFFSNMQEFDTEIELHNSEFTKQQLQNPIFEQLNQSRIQIIQQMRQSATEMLQQFQFGQLFKLIGDTIFIQCSFGTFDFSFSFKLKDLSNIFATLFSQSENGSSRKESSQGQQQSQRSKADESNNNQDNSQND